MHVCDLGLPGRRHFSSSPTHWRTSHWFLAVGSGSARVLPALPDIVIAEPTGAIGHHEVYRGLTGACHHFRQLPLPLWSCEYSIPERRPTQLDDIHLYSKWTAHNAFAAILCLIATEGTVAPSPSPTASARKADLSPPRALMGYSPTRTASPEVWLTDYNRTTPHSSKSCSCISSPPHENRRALALESETAGLLKSAGVKIVAYSPLGRGFTAARYKS